MVQTDCEQSSSSRWSVGTIARGNTEPLFTHGAPKKQYVPSMCPNPTGFSSPLPAKIAQNKLNALSHVSWECYFCLLRGYDSVVAKPSSSQGTLTWVKLRIGYALFQWIVMLVSWFLPNPCDWRSVDLEFLRYEFLGQAEVRGVFGFKTAATLFGAPILNNYNKPINTHEVLWFWGHFFKN